MAVLSTCLNAAGLILITIGGVGSALCTPAPTYHRDGSVSLAASSDKDARVAISRRQHLTKPLLSLIGIGALLQLVALFL
jgi:hypothetical protein